ncbi:mechanosensitive ion channel [Candidatus Woesearchaeota archaeon]|nr:mechanosensitive ion channel [Candidatus Woesearchaeota archaeon]
MAFVNGTGVDPESIVLNPLFSRLILAVFILLLGFIAGRVVGLFVKRILSDIQLDKHVRKVGIKVSIERFLARSLSFVIYFITIILTLDTLALTSTFVTIMLLGLVFLVLISFMLAVKDFFPNLIAGVRIRLKDLFDVGDLIQIKEVKGKVVQFGLLETKLVTSFKEEVIIPNALFTKRKMIVKRGKKRG